MANTGIHNSRVVSCLFSFAARLGRDKLGWMRLQLPPQQQIQQIVCLQLWAWVSLRLLVRLYLFLINLIQLASSWHDR